MRQKNNDKQYLIARIIGLVLIIVSFGVYLTPNLQSSIRGDDYILVFLINHILAAGYFLYIIILHFIRASRNPFKVDGKNFRLFVVLFSISAFSLNKTMEIFGEPTTWLYVYFGIVHAGLILYAFKDYLPKWFNMPIYFIMGMGMTIFTYFSIVLFPVYIMSLALSWLFGFSINGLISLIWVVALIIPFIREKERNYKYWFIAGGVIPIMVAGFFMLEWSKTRDEITLAKQNSNNELPEWVILSQNISDNNSSEWVLKSHVFNQTHYSHRYDLFDFDRIFNGRSLKHDPVTFICYNLIGSLDIESNTIHKIIDTKYKYRHQSIERLWRDDDLISSKVKTSCEIMPEYRMAYVEKTINVKNKMEKRRWRNEQEAIYTFHLPEGAVATSLSLWINGVEEKARLTTKEKADSAYTTIVGKEMRDPSLMHWHEGNRLVVRVFPCTPDEERVFKIGYTTPLLYRDNNLALSNIYIEGPDMDNSDDSVKIRVKNYKKEMSIDISDEFKHEADNYFTYKGEYLNDWEFSMTAPKLSEECFSFNGCSYQVNEAFKTYADIIADNIYLDINNSWSESEYNEALNLLSGKEVYAYNNKVVKITKENSRNIFIAMHKKNFTLFPLYEIEDPEKSLIITKTINDTPLLEDLETESFHKNTFEYISGLNSKIKVLNIGDKQNIYLKTLAEFQALDVCYGDVSTLKDIMANGKFPTHVETPNSVYIPQSNIVIAKSDTTIDGKAPNHIMRLYAYNDIMKIVGRNYFNKEYLSNDIIKIAKESFVVSPISSLVVLESEKDYNRFGIEKEDNSSLHNAVSSSSGAVPEPHEWALIIIAALTAIFLAYKRYKPLYQ